MRLIITMLVTFFMLGCVCTDAQAVSVEELLRSQGDSLEIEELEEAAERAGGTAKYGVTLDEGLASLLNEGASAAGGILRSALRSGTLLVAVVLLCSLGETVFVSAGKTELPVVSVVGALAVSAVAIGDVNAMLGLGRTTIEDLTAFSNVLLPIVAAVTAATGAVTGAAVRQMASILFSDLLVNLINSLLIPILYAYLAASVSHATLGNEGLKQIGALLKWAVTTVLTVVMLSFVTYLTLSGVIAGSADAMTIKATKFAISGAIPVVGGILSDAAETILASAGVLRGTVGVFGAVTILGICLLPVLRMAVHYLMYRLVAAVSATVGSLKVTGLINQIGSAFGLMLGMTGACCLLLLVALVSSVAVISA